MRSLKVYVTPQFVQEFLELFDSEESVERDYLKNILHKLYAKVSKIYHNTILPFFNLHHPLSSLSRNYTPFEPRERKDSALLSLSL